jgi:hypothetical protein
MIHDHTPARGVPENSGVTGARPTQFRRGVSGNPGGRPKLEADIRRLAQAHGPAAIRRLVQLLGSDNERVAVTAAIVLLDRAYGKPSQPLTGADGGPLIPTSAPRVVISIEDATRAYLEMCNGTLESFTFAAPEAAASAGEPSSNSVIDVTP